MLPAASTQQRTGGEAQLRIIWPQSHCEVADAPAVEPQNVRVPEVMDDPDLDIAPELVLSELPGCGQVHREQLLASDTRITVSYQTIEVHSCHTSLCTLCFWLLATRFTAKKSMSFRLRPLYTCECTPRPISSKMLHEASCHGQTANNVTSI
jgi:hypothetical protein